MIFAAFDLSPLTVCINCSFFYIFKFNVHLQLVGTAISNAAVANVFVRKSVVTENVTAKTDLTRKTATKVALLL